MSCSNWSHQSVVAMVLAVFMGLLLGGFENFWVAAQCLGCLSRRVMFRVIGLLKSIMDTLKVDQGFTVGRSFGHIGKSLIPAHVFVVVGMACIDALRNGFVRAI